jgi:CheY-like chemotaxis protein
MKLSVQRPLCFFNGVEETLLSSVATMTETLETAAEIKTSAKLETVLFVEDDSNDFVVARHLLERMHLRNPVRRVCNTEELKQYLYGEFQFADRTKYPMPIVIIVDQRLAGEDGVKAQAFVRSTIRFRNIPIIAISSTERINLLQAALQMGANTYLTKPFDPMAFYRLSLALGLRLEFGVQ